MFTMQAPTDAEIYLDEMPATGVRRQGDTVSIPIPRSQTTAPTLVKVTARREGVNTVAAGWAIAL